MRFITPLVLSLVASYSFAGSAVIPEWRQQSKVQSCINISNISSSNVGVTIKLYKQDGNIYTGTTTNDAELNNEFILEGRKSVHICIPASSSNFMGYGVINGRPIDTNETGGFLVARGVISTTTYDNNRWQSVTINGGNPF